MNAEPNVRIHVNQTNGLNACVSTPAHPRLCRMESNIAGLSIEKSKAREEEVRACFPSRWRLKGIISNSFTSMGRTFTPYRAAVRDNDLSNSLLRRWVGKLRDTRAVKKLKTFRRKCNLPSIRYAVRRSARRTWTGCRDRDFCNRRYSHYQPRNHSYRRRYRPAARN